MIEGARKCGDAAEHVDDARCLVHSYADIRDTRRSVNVENVGRPTLRISRMGTQINVARTLKKFRQHAGMSLEKLAQEAGYKGGSSIQRYEDEGEYGNQYLNLKVARRLADALQGRGNPPIEYEHVMRLAGIDDGATVAPAILRSSSDPDRIIEVEAKVGAGQAAMPDMEVTPFAGSGDTVAVEIERAKWGIPDYYLRAVLNVDPERVRLVEVIGDSMEPKFFPGDRVLVNAADRTPTPPGIFAIWDGLGVALKRIEHVPNSEPVTFVISSDNNRHRAYERTADEVNIIGRVVWLGRKV